MALQTPWKREGVCSWPVQTFRHLVFTWSVKLRSHVICKMIVTLKCRFHPFVKSCFPSWQRCLQVTTAFWNRCGKVVIKAHVLSELKGGVFLLHAARHRGVVDWRQNNSALCLLTFKHHQVAPNLHILLSSVDASTHDHHTTQILAFDPKSEQAASFWVLWTTYCHFLSLFISAKIGKRMLIWFRIAKGGEGGCENP